MASAPPVLTRDFLEAETFDGLWNYKPRFTQVPEGLRAHYVSEGDDRARTTVVPVHGNPTWGFMYRHLVEACTAGARVVVPDHIGFGKSDAVGRASWYTLDRHKRALDAVLDSANVRNVVLVVHDWGGPIGLSWAAANPDKVAGVVILNTWAFAPKRPVRLHPFLQFMRAPILGGLLAQNLDVFVSVGLPRGVVHRGRLTDAVMGAYKAPFPSPAHRAGIRAFPRLVPDKPGHPSWDFMAFLEANLSKLTCPVRIVWGARDPIFPKATPDLFRKRLANVEDVRIVEDASHFVMEDAPTAVADAVQRLMP